MSLRTVGARDFSGKRILMRVEFNVPLENGVVGDDTRIRAALPTLRHLLEQPGVSLVLISHLGRPKGIPNQDYSLRPVATRLSELLGRPVAMAPDCIGEEVRRQVQSLQGGEVLMLENVRFHRAEVDNTPAFAAEIASLGDVYVNDAFGACHRAHASVEGVTHWLPAYAGLLIEKEMRFFEPILHDPQRPMIALIGGAKVSTKIGVLENLLPNCSAMVIAGGMAYTFLKAQGHAIGASLLEEEYLDTATSLLDAARRRGITIVLPSDHVVANHFSADAEARSIDDIEIPDGLIGMDIGPKTIAHIASVVSKGKTVLWNGPMGVFEFDRFAHGTIEVAKLIAKSEAITIVGGGDSVAAVNKFNLTEAIDHLSTGGGASLEFLEGRLLPGLAVLMDQE